MAPLGLLVVGAGWAGLYAAKYARAAGLEVMLLEGREDLGGVWNYSDDPGVVTVMRNTVSSSSRHVTEASDLSMGEAAGNFFRHEDALAFLRAYAERFGLSDRIVTGAKVAEARKEDGIWRVETADGRVFRAERLAIATGVHQRRRPITGPAAGFAGKLVHAGDLKHPLDLGAGPGDHVVVYGGGETAADIIHDLASGTGADVTWAIRGGQHFFRKAPIKRDAPPGHYDRNDMPLDEYSSVVMGLLTTVHKGSPGRRTIASVASSGSLFAYQGHGVAEWTNDIRWFRQFFNKNGHAVEHVWNGRVTPARGVASCDGDRVTFEDGRSVRATHLVCSFGYEADFAFLPEALRATPTDRLYRLVVHPDDPSLTFFGFARPTILSLPYMIELQCLFAQRMWSGEVTLPGPREMRETADRQAEELDALFGYERSNRNIVCPFWYLGVMMEAMELSGYRRLLRRFDPRRDWRLFSQLLRAPASPLLLRMLVADYGPEERARIDRYVTPMMFGFRREEKVSLARYVATYAAVIGLTRLLRIDQILERIAKRRIARRGRAVPLRQAPPRPAATPAAAEAPAPLSAAE
ncbi:NAD(P)-binding domain-containing protein [Albimonas sp. CAU 1670]|uniref:flavin-containing monooxygenase n=1 Tax=Albimonas sp. CAU 1670 TaxID=3032599 RepID=UPI0023DB278D|nr:NAD(P)-binding domain-containing protein [Albimonas sp. CAU 1670]MDF2234814.1 NAD(P)-binding domain-containing protein [Albimonas sp. CAU 1670]